MKKKLLALLMTVAVAAGMLTGCGSTQETQTPVSEENKLTGETVAQETPVLEGKLTVWCWDPAFNINAVNTAADIYKKDHPNFELEVVEISQSDIYQKLATATAAGNTDEVLPDIILFDDALVAQAASSFQGVLLDLTDSGIDYSSFAEAKVACSVVDGRNYGIPFDSGAAIAAYRTDVLQDAGYTIEDFTDITWSEWIEKAVVVKEKTGKSLLNGLGAYNQFSVMLKSCGGGYFDEEGNLNISLTDFLSEVSLLTDQDSDNGDDEKITLMTVHSAKGLEFRNVFVVGLEENLFPSALSLNSYKELEEERRLFYVAITRAEEHCYLSFAKSRFKYGKMEFSSPSRFLKDIDVHFLSLPQEDQMSRRIDEGASRFRREQNEHSASSPLGKKTLSSFEEKPKVEMIRPTVPRNLTKVGSGAASKSSATGTAPMNVQAGQVIEHERFGIGDVIKVEGTGENSKATVRFRNAGEKQLLLKFARFKVVG